MPLGATGKGERRAEVDGSTALMNQQGNHWSGRAGPAGVQGVMAARCQILEPDLWLAMTSRFARDGGRRAGVPAAQAGTRRTWSGHR